MSNKVIYDVIHGYVKISDLCLKIIDTPEFQRLRNLKQLGLTYLIFPSANHTRFEHSLGVSYLAGEMLKHLKNKQPELEITEREIELIKIAGLWHDLGHGPFSHFFDNFFLKLIECDVEGQKIRVSLREAVSEDPFKFFDNYTRKQKIVNSHARGQLEAIEKLYALDNSFIEKLINFGMSSIDNSEILKDNIIRYANQNLSIFR